jgi:multidrug efflux pump subunit AcrA (membrane-fusion protein)
VRIVAAVASTAALLGPLAAVAESPRVIVAEATRLDFPLTVEAPGTARANESVEIRPQISEVITAIHFTEGQRVEAGHVLVELEDSEAKAAVAAARAALVESESRARRAQDLGELADAPGVPAAVLRSVARRRAHRGEDPLLADEVEEVRVPDRAVVVLLEPLLPLALEELDGLQHHLPGALVGVLAVVLLRVEEDHGHTSFWIRG